VAPHEAFHDDGCLPACNLDNANGFCN